MVSRKKIFPLFYCSYLLIYTFCEVLFVLSLINSHVLTIVSATRALPLAFPGPLPFPEGIGNYYLLFLVLILAFVIIYIYGVFPSAITYTLCYVVLHCCRVHMRHLFITSGNKIEVLALFIHQIAYFLAYVSNVFFTLHSNIMFKLIYINFY